MNRIRLLLLALSLSSGVLDAKLIYPETPKIDHIDEYNGVWVADPYRWMEDGNSEQLKGWVAEQNALAKSYFDETSLKQEMLQRLEEIDSYERLSLPIVTGHRWFWTKANTLFDKAVCVRDDFLLEPRCLINSSEFSEDGSIDLSNYFPSNDGKWVAYFLQEGGSDWCVARIRNVETRQDLEDRLEWIKFFPLVWDPKNEGFFYGCYDAPAVGEELTALNLAFKLCYHKLGTAQQDDVLICDNAENRSYLLSALAIVDQRYLGIQILDPRMSWCTGFLYKDLANPNSSVEKVFEDPSARYSFAGKVGEEIFMFTDKGAPKGLVVALQLNGKSRVVIPETSAVLEQVFVAGDRLVCQYLRDGCPEICVFSLEGHFLFELKLPQKICVIEQMRSYPEKREIWLKISSPEFPAASYYANVDEGILHPIFLPKCSWADDDFETELVFYKAKDEMPLILFISHKKGVVLDGKNPTILYGYGSHWTSNSPFFLAARRAWLEKGGIYCTVAVRGGGEYGREPNLFGPQRRQQSIDDFCSAAEWLIEHRYTSKEHLGTLGTSAGGWLVAAAMNHRPDLFGAVVIGNAVLDLLRAPCYTVAWRWFSYGQCWDEKMFSLNYPLSPYHNVKEGTIYPATLFLTGDHDDRVVPLHSYKHLARLQDAQGGESPILLHLQKNQGHFWLAGGKSFEPWASALAFFYRNLVQN